MLWLRALAWVAILVYATVPSYWLFVHRRARRWAETGGKRLEIIGVVWPLLWVVLGAITWRWRAEVLYVARWTWIPGGLLILSGMVTYGISRQSFSSDQVLGRSELQPARYPQRLVTGGIRDRIRHPFYLGHLLELCGWTVGSGLLAGYLLIVFAIITGQAMIRAEEQELEARFGDAYRLYRQRSAAIIPGVW